MIDIEIWKTAIYDGIIYEGLYQVSNCGRLLSLNYHRSGKSKLLKPTKTKKGYLAVGLHKNGKRKMCKVHRLVAETFIPNPDNLPQINHIDENKKNNRVDNLEWCDNKYNTNYGTHNERISKTLTNGKLSKTVLQFSKSGEFIREWPSTMECERNGFDHVAVGDCCRGKQKSAYGYIWRYK